MENLSRIEEVFLSKLRELSPDKQKEALDFVEFLKSKNTPVRSRRSLKGLWADLNVEISEEDISIARQEMWRNFPRESFS